MPVPMNTPGSSFSHSLHPFPGPLIPTHGAERPVPPVDASVVWGILSVRGPLLTVRVDDTLCVLRAGADPRSWKKPLDRHGNGIGPWEPARPPLNDLLRVPAAFPPTAGTIIEERRRALDLPADWSEEVREARAGGWAARSREEWDEDDQTCEGIPFQVGHYKGTSPFPWAWVPGEGERRMRRQAPDPESIGWHRERPPSEREWKRIPPGGHRLDSRQPPACLCGGTYGKLRSTIRRVMMLRRDLPAWAGHFPDGGLEFVEGHRFSTRRWHLINLWLRVPGGRELWDDIPALAWLAASSWLYKQKPVKRPFRSLRALVKKPRACLLRWLDLPAGDGTLALLRSVPGSLMTPRFAHALCRVLRDEDKRRAWSNLRLGVTRRELSLLAYDLPISFPVLRLINEGSRVGPRDRRQMAESVYVDCLKMIRTMGRDDELRPGLARIRSGERLVAFHDELVAELNRLGPRPRPGTNEVLCPGEPWEPPISPAPWMTPIRTRIELHREGKEMHHCVGSYGREVAMGTYYVYAIHHFQYGRATLGMARSGGQRPVWHLSQLQGPCNHDVPAELRTAVLTWLKNPPPSMSGQEIGGVPIQQLWLWAPEVGYGVPPADLPATVGLDARVPLPFREDGEADDDTLADYAAPDVPFGDDGNVDADDDEENPEREAYLQRIAYYRPIIEPEIEEAGDDDVEVDWDDLREWGEAAEAVDWETGERVISEAGSEYEDAMAHHLAWSLASGENWGDDIPF